MKLKFYLRGLGIGIAVTAGILMLAGGGKKTMTDEEVIARAKELGLVENKVLAELNTEVSGNEEENLPEESDSETTENENTDSSQDVSENVSENPSSEQTVSEQEPTEQNTSEPESSEEKTSEQESTEETGQETTEEEQTEEVIEEYVIVTVVGGDSSVAVSKKVFEAGLVESAASFDAFLCSNGYDKILAVGNHEIPKGASMKEIADILVKKSQ